MEDDAPKDVADSPEDGADAPEDDAHVDDAPEDDAHVDDAPEDDAPDVRPAAEASPQGEPDATTDEAPPEDDELAGDRDAIFEALWARALAAWDDDRPHAALLDHALKSESLPELAGRYRALKDDPERSERAQKKIDGLIVAATQMLMATKTPERTRLPWQWSAAAVLFFALMCAWLTYQLFIPRR